MITKGQKINDRYSIIKSIGEGGMANVYLAYDTILDRNVAIKVLRGDLSNDEKFVRRFQREALSASSLSHPNIVEVYDVGEDNGQYYIVMEYIEGKHLKDLIKKRGKLTITETLDIMSQIADGMAQAHDSYIIHRDIKPQNIMILDSGIVKITDFGIAMALNSTQLTQTNSVMGSVHYLPPEQASGKGATIKSDIYSMGILMYELLTGKLPYRGDNAVEIALKHLKEPLPDIKKELPDLPQSVANIVIKACAKNPKNRYNDAREMYEDLKTCMNKDRQNEERYVYKYADNELEETKVVKILESAPTTEKEDILAKQITNVDTKTQNKLVLKLFVIFTSLVLVTTVIAFIVLGSTNKKEYIIPDVTGLKPLKAEEKLRNKKFKIASEYKEVYSSDVKEGLVVKISPVAGSKRTSGTKVTIYVSLGTNEIEIDDYIGDNYIEIKAKLEVQGISVVIEREDVDIASNYDDNEIMKQSVKKGTKLTAGDTITFTIPNIVNKYPNFADGSYTKDSIQEFCNKYSLDCTFTIDSTSTLASGTIIKQSKPEGYTVVAGQKVTITYAGESATISDDALDDEGDLD